MRRMQGAETQISQRPRGMLPSIGLVVSATALLALVVLAVALGLGWPATAYVLGAVLGAVAVVAVVAFTRLVSSPLSQRRIGVLLVVLPSVGIVLMEFALYFFDDRHFSEMTEHLLTASLAAGALPVTIYILRAFARMRDELDMRAQRLRTLHERSVAMVAESSIPRLRGLVAEGAADVLDADRAVHLVAPTAGVDSGVSAVAGDGASGNAALQAEEAELARHVAVGARPLAITNAHAHMLAARVPSDDPSAGTIVASRWTGDRFTAEDGLLLDMLGVAASAGIENARRLEETHFLATVEERDRIARDLHDELGQLLGFLTLRIRAAQELRRRGRYDSLESDLADLEQAVGALGGQVREAILGLRARVGDGDALGEVLADYVQEFGLQSSIETVYEGPPEAGDGLPVAVQHQVLRVAQEALSNARRHSRAARIVVHLEESGGELELTVADDGVGFTLSTPTSRLGLRTMAERAESIGGTLEIRSSEGSGTLVRLLVPTVGR